MSDLMRAVLAWQGEYGNVGTSSKTIAYRALGIPLDHESHPHDPDDLDRCLRLLALIPELRATLPAMREASPQWAALIDRWGEIERSHLDEVGLGWSKGRRAMKTYALMREVLDASA